MYPDWVLDDDGEFVARCGSSDIAARIVREHNTHDDLLEAAQNAAEHLEPSNSRESYAAMRQLQYVIAEATPTKAKPV